MTSGRVVLILWGLFFLLYSCSKNVGSKEPESVLNELTLSYSSNPLKFYSKNTVSSIKQAIRLKITYKNSVNSLLYDFGPLVKYEVFKKEKDHSSAKLNIRYIEHPIENRVGQIIVVKFVLEDAKWKIDKSGDIMGLIKANNSSAIKSYIDSKFSEY